MVKNKEVKKSEIEDIFKGEYLSVWKDDEFVWLSFPWTTINIPLEEWDILKNDLEELADL